VSHALDGVRAKLDRAREHIEVLEREFGEFMNPDMGASWEIRIKRDSDRGECKVTWHQDAPPPLRWSVLFGEFLYDLRSALDHLARCLVVANGETPTTSTEFPVFWREKDFNRRASPKTKGMSAQAKTLIEASQPYRDWPEHPKSTTLWTLHDFCNTDKHRLLHLADPWLFSMRITFLIPGSIDQSFIRATQKPRRMRLEDGAVIAAFEWDPAAMRALGEANVKMEFKASFDVALAEGQWATERANQPTEGMAVRHLMQQCLDYVETTLLPKFEPLV
jgi:hypothetical protein